MPRKKQIETEEPKGEILPVKVALPGSESVDEQLLDNAVQEINRLYITKGMETYQAIGEYVLQTFFDGDVESVRSHGRKHASFRALGDREDLHAGYTFIWRSVNMVLQLRQLPAPVAEQLPFTHHIALLPIKAEDAKRKLAEKAVKGSWTSRQLAGEVKEIRAKQRAKTKVGRPPLPEVVKLVGHLFRVIGKNDPALITEESVRACEQAALKTAHHDLNLVIEDLQGLSVRIQAAIDAAE